MGLGTTEIAIIIALLFTAFGFVLGRMFGFKAGLREGERLVRGNRKQ